ncbi:MAG: rhodanese-like domain-containing protein, partial [Perlabentimonas sp.]
MIKSISTKELASFISASDVYVIDTRPVDAYNGWQLEGEKRGGHIKGAKSLPLKWTKYMDWIEIVRSKGIAPNHKVIIYGYSENDSQLVAQQFVKAGYGDVAIYMGFVEEWSANESLPMERLERFRNLVPASWVNNLINGGSPAHYNSSKFVVVHAHYRNRD